MQTILITGGAGYIGSHTAKALAAAGFEPVVFDNLSTGHANAVRWGPFVQADLADITAIREALVKYKITAVVHFAAFAYVGESMRDPQKYFRNNVANTLNLLEAMLDCGVKTIVFSSTCATYGLPRRLPLTEGHRQSPVNPYGESKLFIERVLRWYGEIHGLKWFVLRHFNAAGANPEGEIGEDHSPETHLVPLAIQAALGQRPAIDVFGTDYPTPDGTAIRDYIHVSDLAEAHRLALRYLAGGGSSGACNLGTGKGHSVMDVIRAVEAVTGRQVPIVQTGRRAGDPPVLVASNAKARRVLGWKPRLADLKTIIETAVAWHTSRNERLFPVP
ncbi:MAG: UDP-glucose 4-epimerase GalE [Lentisphaeria bacterium]